MPTRNFCARCRFHTQTTYTNYYSSVFFLPRSHTFPYVNKTVILYFLSAVCMLMDLWKQSNPFRNVLVEVRVLSARVSTKNYVQNTLMYSTETKQLQCNILFCTN